MERILVETSEFRFNKTFLFLLFGMTCVVGLGSHPLGLVLIVFGYTAFWILTEVVIGITFFSNYPIFSLLAYFVTLVVLLGAILRYWGMRPIKQS